MGPARRSPPLLPALVSALAAACGGSDAAVPPGDAAPDAAIDAPGCTETVLFAGGTAPEAQGWLVQSTGAATYGAASADTTFMRTATQGAMGAQLLFHRPSTVAAGAPLGIEIVMRVDAVSAHNQFDSAAALMGAFTPPFGSSTQRAQMVYVDANRVGWADDSQSAAVNNADGAFHAFRLLVDAAGNARLLRDGVMLLSRSGFEVNGAIAFGDQTNDRDVEAELAIRSVTRLCP